MTAVPTPVPVPAATPMSARGRSAIRATVTLIVFALSIDDFVVTQYMSSNSSTTTIPMYLYSNARGGTSTPALNALATILVAVTLIGIVLAYLLYTVLGKRTATTEGPLTSGFQTRPTRAPV